jgi:hypothetical protein
MPGLFDALKEGTFSLFAGPQDPRVAPGTGRSEALIQAGLATIASQSSDPLEAIAAGIATGRQAGQAAQERQLGLQQQAQLAGFVQEAGFDRAGLTSVFMRVLASGDIESAKAVSEILKSMPDPGAGAVNRQRIETIASAAPQGASLPAGIEADTPIQVQQDPRTGKIFWETATPTVPSEPDFSTDQRLKGGVMHQVIVDRNGVEVQDLGPVPTGGAGGAQGQINRNLASAMQQAEETLSTVDEELANPIVNILGGVARGGGIAGNLANMALGAISPRGQMAMAASDQWTAATVRLLSGAQMTEVERQGYRAAYLPQGGERPEVSAQKAAARGALAALFAEGDGIPTVGDLNAILTEAGLPLPGPLDPDNPFAGLVPGDGSGS